MQEENAATDKAPLSTIALGSTCAIALREITKENLSGILKLKVASYQEKFVASNAVSIAQAHFSPLVAWFRAIYADEVPVGFVMLEDDPNNSSDSSTRGNPYIHVWG
jgi:hypothetical protein